MKVTLYMAISINGYIAREDGEEDFLSDANWDTLVELTRETGCSIWGRRTNDVVKKLSEKYTKPLQEVKKVVVTNDNLYDAGPEMLKAFSPEEALQILADRGFENVILSGGAHLNSSFAKLGLINEIIVNTESLVVGKGLNMFASDDFDLDLELQEVKKLDDRIIQARYTVKN